LNRLVSGVYIFLLVYFHLSAQDGRISLEFYNLYVAFVMTILSLRMGNSSFSFLFFSGLASVYRSDDSNNKLIAWDEQKKEERKRLDGIRPKGGRENK